MTTLPKRAEVKKIVKTDGSATITFVSKNGPLNFLGGQYVIFNSGLKTPEGKEIKRAYSIFSSDLQQEEFQICIQPIQGGPASNHIPNLAIGSELEFSGPWGKFIGNPDWPKKGKTLLVATDTGITAINAILHSSRWKFKLKETSVLWFFFPKEKSVPVQEILQRLPKEFHFLNVIPIPKINHPYRSEECIRSFIEELDSSIFPTSAFLAGDGKLIRTMKNILLVRGMNEEDIGMETFFNSAKKIGELT
ncbi:FAD-dependent oxidoreductase [Leptospira alexanderi]|uniref:FAD-dependent oxidoreductase n=1 Tax=Leptospira alexanderi TaxID=100053 RepID=UPI000991179E|nr:FAD-dependent oxidoreductase [Leptospira alexanderi]